MTPDFEGDIDPATLGPEADRRLALAIYAAGIGVWQAEIGSRHIEMDSNLAVAFGYPAAARRVADAEWIGRIHADDRMRFTDTLAARRKDNLPLSAEVRVVWPDGSIRWLAIHGSVVRRPDGAPYGSVGIGRDVTERVAANDRAQLLLRELHHRVRNAFASVIAVANQTAASNPAIQDFLPIFRSRVLALSRAHDLLSREARDDVDLADLVNGIVQPDQSRDQPRISVEGPRHMLNANQALSLTLALHELTTNARKYGALSVPQGTVIIAWRRDAAGMIALEWTERNGPPVSPPTRAGFGTRLLDEAFGLALGGTAQLEFAPTGVVCRIEFSA